MSKISPNGFIKTDIFNDFSIFSLNNTIIGQYSAKINKGSNNVIIGNNAGKLGLQLNNSIIIGANAENQLLFSDKIITIGNGNGNGNLKESINIGFLGNNSNTIHIDYFNNPVNKILDIFNKQFPFDLGIGNLNNIPIVISSKRDIITSSQFYIDGSTNTNSININYSITFKYNDKFNVIYNLPSLPNYDNSFLSTDKYGNLEWLEISDNIITLIKSSSDIICNNLDIKEITGNSLLISNLDLSNFTTDDLKEGLLNLYFNTSVISTFFYNYLKTITSDLIKANYFNDDKYKLNFNKNLELITTDNLNSNSNSNIYYSYNDYYSNTLNYFYNLNGLKEGSSNLYFNSNIVKINLDVFKEGSSNFYFNSNLYDYLIDSNLKTTDFIKQGSNNLYFNSNIKFKFNINTDDIKQGLSNLYSTDYNIYNYLNSNLPITDDITQGTSNFYFTNISNFIINSDIIKEGNNKYLNNSNQLLGTIQYNTNTDFYNEGTSNLYYNEKRGIDDFKKIIVNSNISDAIQEGKNKFIKNNFYNNNLIINGFLKSSNINVNNLNFDKELLRNNLEPKIGHQTEIINTYDFNSLYINSRLCNIELKYNLENTNTEIPFIVLDNKIGICNPNPRYQLDVNGNINTSNLFIKNNNISNIYISSNYYLSNARLILNENNIYSNNNKYGLGIKNPQSFLHLSRNDSLISEDIKIKFTDRFTLNGGFEIGKDYNNKCYIWNNENTDIIFGINNINRLLIKNNNITFTYPSNSAGYLITNNYNRKVELLTLGGGEYYGNAGNGNRNIPFLTIYNRIDANNFNTALKIETSGTAFDGINTSTNIFMDSGDTISSPSIIKFSTLNTERLVIYNQNIGIGTNIPLYQLDIKGDINLTGDIRKNGLILSQWYNNVDSLYYNGNVGIGTSTPSLKLSVIGDISATGSITSSYSDIRLKRIHSNIEKPFDIINKINGFYYSPNEFAKNLGFINDIKEIGLNAQEIREVLPEIVNIAPFDLDINRKSKSGENYLTVSYERLIPVLLEGIKELKKDIEDIKQKLSYNK